MKSRQFAIDPWLPFVAVFVLMYMVIPLLMMWIGLNQGYNLDAVTTVSRVTMYSLSLASVVVFLVFVAFRGSAIHHAARSGQVWFLEKMIGKGRSIDTRTMLKRTPLHFACKADRRAAVIFLLRTEPTLTREISSDRRRETSRKRSLSSNLSMSFSMKNKRNHDAFRSHRLQRLQRTIRRTTRRF